MISDPLLKLVPLHTDSRDPDTFLIARTDTDEVLEEYTGLLGHAKVEMERLELELRRRR